MRYKNDVKPLVLGLLISSIILVLGISVVYATSNAKLVICNNDSIICPSGNYTISFPIMNGMTTFVHFGDCVDQTILKYQSSNRTWVCSPAPLKTIVTTNYTSGTSMTMSGLQTGDKLIISAKGDVSGLLVPITTQLNVAGISQDQVVSSLGITNQLPFSLSYQYSVPSSSNVVISVTSGGTLADVKIQVIQIR